ncbi:MAG: extracellular solute-binding protein [Lachnospiraceae bacterium]|nr:extracellular solute-binding protein [Lachnospiraceae bacterium]
MKLRKFKKSIMVALTATMIAGTVLTGCGNDGNDGSGISADSDITVIAREEGSGTRSAFVELMGVVDADDKDITVSTAEITSSTSVMLTTVKDNVSAIGYVSLGSLSDDVKAVKVDGVEATAENVKNGSYKVSRPFNIAYKEDKLSDLAKDFISYIMSNEGQAIIEEEGYIAVGATESYTASNLEGKVVLAGSTSVAPVMEKLAEEYMKLNSGVTIEIQQSGSSAGMTSTIEDACDIGMASRDVKDSEIAEGLTATKIAVDGIAVIVNKENTFADDLTREQIKGIYLGEITTWSLK